MTDDQPSGLPALTARIGLVAASWARFEFLTNEIIWHLANVDITFGACITAQILSPSNRFRALIALVDLRGGPAQLISDLNKFRVVADGLARQRNRAVHDPWIAGEGRNIRVEVTADKKLTYKAHDVDLTELDKLAKKISELIDRLLVFQQRIRAETPPWPDTQHKESLGKDPILAILGLDIER